MPNPCQQPYLATAATMHKHTHADARGTKRDGKTGWRKHTVHSRMNDFLSWHVCLCVRVWAAKWNQRLTSWTHSCQRVDVACVVLHLFVFRPMEDKISQLFLNKNLCNFTKPLKMKKDFCSAYFFFDCVWWLIRVTSDPDYAMIEFRSIVCTSGIYNKVQVVQVQVLHHWHIFTHGRQDYSRGLTKISLYLLRNISHFYTYRSFIFRGSK